MIYIYIIIINYSIITVYIYICTYIYINIITVYIYIFPTDFYTFQDSITRRSWPSKTASWWRRRKNQSLKSLQKPTLAWRPVVPCSGKMSCSSLLTNTMRIPSEPSGVWPTVGGDCKPYVAGAGVWLTAATFGKGHECDVGCEQAMSLDVAARLFLVCNLQPQLVAKTICHKCDFGCEATVSLDVAGKLFLAWIETNWHNEVWSRALGLPVTYFSTKFACCCQDSLLQRLAIGLMSLLKLPLHALAEAFELTLLEG